METPFVQLAIFRLQRPNFDRGRALNSVLASLGSGAQHAAVLQVMRGTAQSGRIWRMELLFPVETWERIEQKYNLYHAFGLSI